MTASPVPRAYEEFLDIEESVARNREGPGYSLIVGEVEKLTAMDKPISQDVRDFPNKLMRVEKIALIRIRGSNCLLDWGPCR
jgi:hypothetical protein